MLYERYFMYRSFDREGSLQRFGNKLNTRSSCIYGAAIATTYSFEALQFCGGAIIYYLFGLSLGHHDHHSPSSTSRDWWRLSLQNVFYRGITNNFDACLMPFIPLGSRHALHNKTTSRRAPTSS